MNYFLNPDTIYKEVKRLVTESPDNHYNKPNPDDKTCSYFKGLCDNGSVGCLFGQAIINTYPNYYLKDIEGQGVIIAFENVLSGLSKFFNSVQSKQDGGWSWKEAWNNAVKEPFDVNVEKV